MRNLWMIFVLFYSFSLDAQYDLFLNQEIEQLSYYMGYMMGKDHVKNAYDFPVNFDKLVEGMKAGIEGDPIHDKDELVPLIKRMQKAVVERQATLNLQEAESYLMDISQRENLVEVERSKLFYLVKEQGNGQLISDPPLFHFNMNQWKDNQLQTIYSTYDDRGEPVRVDLEAAVVGFRKGVSGMTVGETRVIYVHPDLAFGLGKLDIAPNRLIVFEVHAAP